MAEVKDVLQADLVKIINTATAAVCERFPILMAEKTPELFQNVVGIVTKQQNKYKDQIMKDFKEGIITKLLGDNAIENMLKGILTDGAKNMISMSKYRAKTGGQSQKYLRTKTQKRKTTTKKNRKSYRKI